MLSLTTTTTKCLIALHIVVAALAAVLVSGARHDQPLAASVGASTSPTETVVFAGGCFWGLQGAFDKLPGVISTRVGYTGGTLSNPTYGQVVAGRTGHAEVVEVEFDPSRISFEQAVRHFFAHHWPTSDEPEASYRQRAYRSAIFVNGPAQREVAVRVRREVAERNAGNQPVATLIEDKATFWEAEAYHQEYLAKCAP